MSAIEVEGLTCGYGEQIILKEVTFRVEKGEAFFIIGPSGCGKSTLLRHMVGLMPPLAGDVRFFGRPFANADLATRREQLRHFGVLFQGGALWSSLSLRENIALPLELHTELSAEEIDRLVGLRLSQVGLGGFEEFYPSDLSGGMRKRAGLARALALDPEIVFFDEPSAGLDPVTARRLDDLVREIRETLGTTIVIVSHELASIFGLADRLIMLDREAQGIIAEGRPRELAASSPDPRVRDFLRLYSVQQAGA